MQDDEDGVVGGRPEYVVCVLDPARKYHALCGRYVGFDFAFQSPEHATNTESSGSRLTVCPECRAKMGRGGTEPASAGVSYRR